VIRIVVWLLLLAAVLYAVFWAIDRRDRFGGPGGGSGGRERPRTPKPPPSSPRGPVGPDDDEAFLRDLERRRRREQGDQPPG
jgi:hypothetical protein